MSIAVFIDNKTDESSIPSLADFQEWTNTALATASYTPEDTISEVTITIVDQAESAALNETFRDKVGPTNVLAFTYDPIPGVAEESLGDLAICVQVMQTEAQQQNIPITSHWAHLTIHGILHLLGYDHIEPDDAVIMEALEIKALAKLGFDNPYEQMDHV